MTTDLVSNATSANDTATKYGLSTKEWERLGESLMSSVADQFVADGIINPKGKSKQQLALEAMKIARKTNGSSRYGFACGGHTMMKISWRWLKDSAPKVDIASLVFSTRHGLNTE